MQRQRKGMFSVSVRSEKHAFDYVFGSGLLDAGNFDL